MFLILHDYKPILSDKLSLYICHSISLTTTFFCFIKFDVMMGAFVAAEVSLYILLPINTNFGKQIAEYLFLLRYSWSGQL